MDERKAHRDETEMLTALRAAERNGTLRETLIRELSRPHSAPAFWAVREFLFQLTDREIGESPVLIPVMALIQSMRGDLREAERYVSMLRAYQDPRMELYRLSAELVMPYITDEQFVGVVQTLAAAHAGPVQSLTISACRPSILNGFRDFSAFGDKIVTYKEPVCAAIAALYGSSATGIYEIALAEWYYQRNECFKALLLVTGTIPFMEQMHDMRCLFVALALQMRILLMNGQARSAGLIAEKIRRRISVTGWEELTDSLEALNAWAACSDGNYAAARRWLNDRAPDEDQGIYMMNVYAYLIKARCYIVFGRHMKAAVLVRRLIALLEPGRRYTDICECYALSAMAALAAGDEDRACADTGEALALSQQYGYYRLLADEGEFMVRLLSLYEERVGADAFTEKIKGLAMEVARQCPRYLRRPWEDYEPLTRVESYVLHLLSQERTNEEIAENLNIKIGTVKFHITNINRKLRVKNRRQAVRRARELSLLREE